ncbi:MAG: glycine cleavage system protein GcvH [Pseudochelatococcus sp.]|jgi:glycine cleavage system H protein|uniref:glycine cleavage system protein GcvH n=1 Tax=Pseudochelatococcus sp. TaxID=2020869 RepID=UPI003D910E13
MSDIRYTRDHEYIRVDEGAVATVGISDHAQSALGDVVFVELPEVGRVLKAGEQAAVVESVKAASEVFAPASGRVVAVNTALEDNPATVNEDPLGNGWFFRLELADPTELTQLLDEAAYADYIRDLA